MGKGFPCRLSNMNSRLLVLVHACMLNRFSHVRLFATPWTVAYQAPLSMGFSRQEYWSGLPCPSPGDLPNLTTELASPAALALQVDSLPLSQWGGPTGSSRGSFASQGTLVSVWRLKIKKTSLFFIAM